LPIFHLLGLPELVLELLALGDVHHRADHPSRAALAVAEHVAAVEYAGVRAVGPQVPVLRAPALGAAVDRRADVAHHPLAILGVDALVPPGDVGRDLVRGVAEERLHALVQPQLVAHQIPVPPRRVGPAAPNLKALLALAQRAHQALGGAASQLLV